PGSVLITSRDIITLWVARMVLTGLYNMDDVPFQHVHVHPKILDGFGQTMSKSKGNGVDPVDLIEKYGADAIRFTIASFAGETQDVRLPISYECPHCEEMIAPKQYKLDTSTIVVPSTMKGKFPVPQGAPKPSLVCSNKKCKKESQFTTPLYDANPDEPIAKMVSERFEYGRNFCNKFWNAARFAMMNLEESDSVSGSGGAGYTAGEVTEDQLQLEDRWILSRLSTVANQMDEFLGRYQFDAATRAIRDFTWNEFCDWYLEMIKPRLRDSSLRSTAQRVLLAVLDSLVRLLQPFTPFICEDLWHRLNEIAPERALPVCSPGGSPGAKLSPQSVEDSCINASWPKIPAEWQDKTLENRFERLQDTIVAVRNVRAIYNIPPGTSVKLLMRTNAEVADDMQSVSSQFDNLTKAVLEAAGADVERPSGSASFSLGDADGYIPLEGLIDTEAELERQQKQLTEVNKHIRGAEGKLKNDKFVNSAPEAVVNGVRESLAGLQSQRKSIEEIIRDLS
ncbi:MAG: class I tRNA ligase family protein, partial [Planctomicrobium sp.]|nr:class I tRNA ligase family protein [Planctomicrobium sp.]